MTIFKDNEYVHASELDDMVCPKCGDRLEFGGDDTNGYVAICCGYEYSSTPTETLITSINKMPEKYTLDKPTSGNKDIDNYRTALKNLDELIALHGLDSYIQSTKNIIKDGILKINDNRLFTCTLSRLDCTIKVYDLFSGDLVAELPVSKDDVNILSNIPFSTLREYTYSSYMDELIDLDLIEAPEE